MKPILVVLIIILLSITWNLNLMYGKIPNREHMALKRLYNKTGGDAWERKYGWEDGVPGTENNWLGITCDTENKTVLEIKLKRNNLNGEIPADLSALENLESLVLSDNQLEDVHEYAGKLSKLTTLDLSSNRLTGPIPSWIGKLTNLKRLDLSYNRLTGTIPAWIGNLENLEELRLDGNRLQGPIPGELGDLSKLKVLRIGHNRLTGQIPPRILRLTRLADNMSNFKWNGLYTDNEELRTFLKKKQTGRGWESTQTVPPKNITVFSPSNTSIAVNWDPIAYTADSGGYRVYYSTSPGGPYKLGEETEDKTASAITVEGLKQSTTYYFVLRAWTSRHGSNLNNVVESKPTGEVSVTTLGITISGTVSTFDGQAVPGVKLEASNNGGSTSTDSDGNYHLGVTFGWRGTVTPLKNGYDFSPPTQEYPDVHNDLSNQHYTAKANTVISGNIADSKGTGVQGVVLTSSGKEEKETTAVETDSKGNYTYAAPYNWTGTLTPAKNSYKFEPPKRDYTRVTSAHPGKDHKAFRLPEIGGRVTDRRGKGIPGVTLTFEKPDRTGPDTVETGVEGEYSKVFTGIETWSGSVTPSKKKVIFYPAKKNYRDVTLDTVKRAESYRAERDFKLFISLTGNYRLPSETVFKNVYGNSVFNTEIKAGYKIYRDVYIWSGFGFSSKNGELIEINEPAKWEETFFSMGLGYYKNLSVILGYRVDVGLCRVKYKEEAFGDQYTGTAWGERVDAAGILKISDRLFTEISVGYLFASDAIDDISIKLGGFKTGIALGLKF